MNLILRSVFISALCGYTVCHEIIQHEELYDIRLELNCTDHDFDPHNITGVTYQWMLPSGVVVSQPSFLQVLDAMNSSSRLTVLDNGARLQINALDKPDFGLYVCLALGDRSGSLGVVHAVRHGVNMDGPYYGDQLAEYQPHIRTGFLAGVTVFVVTGLICCNFEQAATRHDRKLKERKKRAISAHASSVQTTEMQFYNNGLLLDDDIVQTGYRQFDEEMKERPPTKF